MRVLGVQIQVIGIVHALVAELEIVEGDAVEGVVGIEAANDRERVVVVGNAADVLEAHVGHAAALVIFE